MTTLLNILLLLTPAQAVFTAPLPGSAAMGIALIGGVAMFARFPSSRRKRRPRPRKGGLSTRPVL